MTVGQAAVEEVLLLLKVAFLLLLYLFIWRIVRAASRDLRAPQESMVLAPPARAPSSPSPSPGRLVVVAGPEAEDRRALVLDSTSLTIGRGRTTTSYLTRTGSPPSSTPASSLALTGSGSRTPAPPTAPT